GDNTLCVVFFFFQAEDGIRVFHVTGVQTCALPILRGVASAPAASLAPGSHAPELPGAKEAAGADATPRMVLALTSARLLLLKRRDRKTGAQGETGAVDERPTRAEKRSADYRQS